VPTSSSSLHNNDAEGQMEQDDGSGPDQPSLMPPTTPQGAQQRIAISSKPFQQFYILLEHYNLPIPTSSHTMHPPSDEDDMENAVLTSPNIGSVAVVQKPVKQTLHISPIISFINAPHQYCITIDMKEVPGPATTQYQGTPEHRNSSWLDAAEWEPLYIIACHDPAFWTWMHGPLTTPTQSRMDDLRRCFALRTAVYQLAVEDEIPKLLQGIRDSFHSRLRMPSDGPHGPLAEPTQPSIPFVSNRSSLFYLSLKPPFQHVTKESIRRGTEDPRTIAYFTALKLTKLFCPGSNENTPQANLSFHFTRDLAWGPTPEDLGHNSLQDWVNSVTTPEGDSNSTCSCWYSGSSTTCNAQSLHQARNWTLKIPVAWMLNLEVMSWLFHPSRLTDLEFRGLVI